jgi:hypothetical protein
MTGSTISYSGILAAGATLQIALAGTQFYLAVASTALFIRPTGVSPYSLFQPGMGMEAGAQFTQIEINNPSTSPASFQVIASSGSIIDHRLVPNIQQLSIVVPPTWTDIFDGFQAILLDKTGTIVFDSNGTPWTALQRQSLVFSLGPAVADANPNSLLFYAYPSLVELFQAQGITGSGQNLPVSFSISGSFLAKLFPSDGGPQLTTGQVFETYLCIAPGYAGAPPN